jgi:prepilin signal peptidase PulO-like enzyme (type II secretory pathway)
MKITDRARRVIQSLPAGFLRALIIADAGWLLIAGSILASDTPWVPALLALAGLFVIVACIGGALGVLAAVLGAMRIQIASLEYVEQRHQESIDKLLEGQKLTFDLVYKGEQLRLQEMALSRKAGRT